MIDLRRSLLAIAATTVILVLLFYAALQTFLMSGFAAVERNATVQNVQRANDALVGEYDRLGTKSADWANWDDTYAFMTDENPEYVTSNLTDQAFTDLQINVILFLRPDGQLIEGKAFDLENQVEVPVPEALQSQLSPSSLLLKPTPDSTARLGLVLLPQGPMAVTLRPILTSNALGPSHGTLLMGRYIDTALVQQVSLTTHLDVQLYPLTGPLPENLRAVPALISDVHPIVVRPMDDETIAGSAILDDIYGRPALLLNLTTPRPIYAQGRATLAYIVLALVCIAVISGLVSHAAAVRAARAVKESEERYAIAAEGANDGLWDWNLQRDQVYYSPRWKSMLGFQGNEVSTGPNEWLDRIHSDDRARVKAEIAAHLDGRSKEFESEFRILNRNGEPLWVLCRGLAVRRRDGRPYRMAGSLSDISSRKRAEAQLVYDALHDSLTRLPNRVLLHERLDQAIERTKRSLDKRYAVLYLDLDNFKGVNDTYGHGLGDRLLITCAHRLQICVRSMDTVARMGGDEFVILLEEVQNSSEVIAVAERIVAQLRSPFELDGHRILVSASIGIVVGIPSYERGEQVLRDADIAMYQAKSGGRDRYERFDATMRNVALEHLEIKADLHDALDRDELEVHYQPVVDLKTRRVMGFEALARWRHPRRGYVPPAEFIPIAEETGMIMPLGNWVLHRACSQMQQWLAEGLVGPDTWMSVNISAKQFGQRDLLQRIGDILEETELPARNLHLEITETTIMDNTERSQKVVEQLREAGVQFEIDDFGSGYSSLGSLQQFAIHTLKIGRPFVSQIDISGDGKTPSNDIIRTIVWLAHRLRLAVIAEGIETAGQLSSLQSLDCQMGQGYLFSEPIPAGRIERLLQTQPGLAGIHVDARQDPNAPTDQDEKAASADMRRKRDWQTEINLIQSN